MVAGTKDQKMTTIKIEETGFKLFFSSEELEKSKANVTVVSYTTEQVIADLRAAADMIENNTKGK